MAAFPSIQSFYKKEGANPCLPHAHQNPLHDSGFTQAEVEATTNPLSRDWQPTQEYEDVLISQIQPGPTSVRFSGRLIAYSPAVELSGHRLSKPWHQLIIKDDTGAIGVKLVPLGVPVSQLLLGQLVTVWATLIGDTTMSTQGSIPFVTMFTPIRPGHGGKQHIEFSAEAEDTRSLYRLPLDHGINSQRSSPLPGLMTLSTYLKTGYDDVRGARILVCVNSVGPKKTVQSGNSTRSNGTSDLVEVTICDDTAECALTLWEDKINSTKPWRPNETILLLTSPKFQPAKRKDSSPGISIGYATLIEVDPAFADADWLRQWARNRIKKNSVNIPFPSEIWDLNTAVHGAVRALFTIAEVDEFVRADPSVEFTGKLNVIILGMELVNSYRQRKLFCIDCCGVPLFANSPSATCKNCQLKGDLALNPKVIGTLADETGCIAHGKLVWSSEAWRDLFIFDQSAKTADPSSPALTSLSAKTEQSKPWNDLIGMEANSLRVIEERMLYARLTLTFG